MIPRGRQPDRQRGSMAVEFVIAVPGFLILMLLIAAGGDWVSSAGQVAAAASDAARAASLARNWQAAQSAATSAADFDLGGACAGGSPTITPEPLPPAVPLGSNFATATAVQVTVQCSVNLQAFSVIGFNSDTTFTRTAVAPLDQLVQRS